MNWEGAEIVSQPLAANGEGVLAKTQKMGIFLLVALGLGVLCEQRLLARMALGA